MEPITQFPPGVKDECEIGYVAEELKSIKATRAVKKEDQPIPDF